MAWTNLGVFYLLHGRDDKDSFLAHECFKKSQAIDPEYGEAWIGQVQFFFFFFFYDILHVFIYYFGNFNFYTLNFQALIAEKVSKTEESIDLYRHSVELGLHVSL